MQTIRYYIAWMIIAVTCVFAVMFFVSWGKETYQWYNAKDLAHDQIDNSSQYAEGTIRQIIACRYGKDTYEPVQINSPDKHVYYLASDGSRDGKWIVINVPERNAENFEAQFDKNSYTGIYRYKIKPSRVTDDYGVDNIVKLYTDKAVSGYEFNQDRHQIVTDYCIDYVPEETQLSVWKLFLSVTLIVLALPSISTVRAVGKHDAFEYITDPDEYCRQRIELIDKRIDSEDNIEVLESELESVYENNRIYRKKYISCEFQLVSAMIVVVITGASLWLAFTRIEYRNLLTDGIFGLFVSNCANAFRCVRNLVENQYNRMSILLAVQTGGTPIKAEMFINEVLITRYESRIAQLNAEKENNNKTEDNIK